jgi:hypothetical protein
VKEFQKAASGNYKPTRVNNSGLPKKRIGKPSVWFAQELQRPMKNSILTKFSSPCPNQKFIGKSNLLRWCLKGTV